MIILGIDPGYATVGYGVVNYDRGRFALVRSQHHQKPIFQHGWK